MAEEREIQAKHGLPPELGEADLPNIDIFETNDRLVLLADIPGAGDENVEVNVEEDILTIAANVPAEPMDAARIARTEYEPRQFRRSFSLSRDISRDGIVGKVRDGVLRLELPKVPEAKVHRIQIKTE